MAPGPLAPPAGCRRGWHSSEKLHMERRGPGIGTRPTSHLPAPGNLPPLEARHTQVCRPRLPQHPRPHVEASTQPTCGRPPKPFHSSVSRMGRCASKLRSTGGLGLARIMQSRTRESAPSAPTSRSYFSVISWALGAAAAAARREKVGGRGEWGWGRGEAESSGVCGSERVSGRDSSHNPPDMREAQAAPKHSCQGCGCSLTELPTYPAARAAGPGRPPRRRAPVAFALSWLAAPRRRAGVPPPLRGPPPLPWARLHVHMHGVVAQAASSALAFQQA